ncbi:MAG: cobalamin biosynthesis protein P47K [Eubacteriaceae bacterium]|jgi:G3E family GTPase|nr:cobalamin biosynthesis protein P47K [Eubacteriaceae bacterium]
MKFIVLGGFLGAGKTSALIQFAKHLVGDNPENATKCVIIENEIGEIGIDDQVLKNDGGYEVKGLFSGCVCCSMSGELVVSLHKIMNDLQPEFIIMEATGVAYPANIKETVENSLKIPAKIVCLVDAKRWKRLLVPMAMLIPGQLEGAEVILINKIDTVDETALSEIDESVKGFNDTAIRYHISANEHIDEAIWEKIVS